MSIQKQINEVHPLSNILYRLFLLVNLANEPGEGGLLVVDTLTFDPSLSVGDEIEIKDWKVGTKTETGSANQEFSFSARVMTVKKIIVRHDTFIVEIILESPEMETVSQLCKALRARNPQHFHAIES